MNVTEFIREYPNAFSDDLCDSLISYLEEADQSILMHGHADNGRGVRRDVATSLAFIPDSRKVRKESTDLLNKFLDEYISEFAILRGRSLQTSSVKLQKTMPKEGFHNFHYESADAKFEAVSRQLVWLVYLNSIEEGGETEFLFGGEKVKPEKGKLVIFPVSFTHTHRGNPIYSGCKYIATGWYYDVNKGSSL